jgi:hypothetical protein
MSGKSGRVLGWWVLILIGAGAALLIAWLAHVVSVPLTALLTVGAVVIALSWLIVLVTVPWNLHFAARRAAAEMAVSRERGISVRAAYDAEAARISRRMLRFALSAHLATAVAAAVIAYVSGSRAGYYVAGIFLLSTAFRPAGAYVAHVRERIKVLTRESTHPRDDVAALRGKAEELGQAVDELRTGLQDAQAADRTAARSRDDELSRRIDRMARRIEATLDGITDHQELLAGLRALVRMVRSDPA